MTDGPAGVAAYYDNLSRFLDFTQPLGRGGGSAQGSTHRFLARDAKAARAAHPDLHHGPELLDLMVLQEAITSNLRPSPRVLDAGCGLGGTIFRWQERLGGTYDGFTLSSEQQHRATLEATRRGVASACRFHIRSYQDPIAAGSYHAVVAIESLAHSPDPDITIANLAAALTPGGLLLIVDDIPDEGSESTMLTAFKRRWRCPVLADVARYRAAITAAGLMLMREIDWSRRLRPRSLAWLKILIAAFKVAYRLSPTRAARDVIDALLGGFLLEALYRTDAMRYRFIIAKKPAPDVR